MCFPLRPAKTRNKIFQIALLIAFSSCGTVVNRSETDAAQKEHSKQAIVAHPETPKHQTFNETISTLPEILKPFIPKEYAALNTSSGDANLDGFTDVVLILGKKTEATTSDYADNKPDKRPLLLLLGQPDGSYKLAVRNDNAVYCIDCGGIFGDPFTGTTIKNGYFSIEHGIAGGQHWEHVTTFKFDKAKGNWLLYKDHFISYKLSDSNNENAQALVKETDKLETVKNFGKILFNEFNIYSDSRR